MPYKVAMNKTMTMWQEKIRDMNVAGLSFREMCEELGCGLGTIGDLARGKTRDATYTLGVKIIALHKRVMRRKGNN